MKETHSRLAITPAVRVEPLFPPHPTSITLPEMNENQNDKTDPEK
jgi:hypothetical protein